MKLRKNKRGLAAGIVALTLSLFIFAFASLVTLAMWDEANAQFQSLDNETAPQVVKDKIDALTVYMRLGDRIFIYFFVALLLAYIISSVTLPTEQPVFFILFMGILIFTTVLAMVLSNAWAYLIENPFLSSAAEFHTLTDFFMTYFPIFVFFIGLAGAILFYGRRFKSISGGDIIE